MVFGIVWTRVYVSDSEVQPLAQGRGSGENATNGSAPVLLDVRDLTVSFGRRRSVNLVRGVNFDIRRGETVGLVGETGSGKSMTALALMRLVPAPGRITGRVDFDGVDLLGLSEPEMRDLRGRRIAMVFQDPMSSFNPVMSVGAQIDEA